MFAVKDLPSRSRTNSSGSMVDGADKNGGGGVDTYNHPCTLYLHMLLQTSYLEDIHLF